MQLLQRGRVAKWTKERLDTLTTIELRQLLANAERLQETDVAALCSELLGGRPRGLATVRRQRPNGVRRLVARGKAFEMRGATVQSRIYSRSGVRAEDDTIIFAIPAEDVQHSDTATTNSCCLWAPNTDGAHPWSDKPGGQERLAHCVLALARGHAEGMLVYGKGPEGAPAAKSAGVDADHVLNLKIEKRGEEYWATWPEVRRTTVTTMS